MTREELKDTIKNLKLLKSFHNGSYGSSIDEAIKALEQEPITLLEQIKAEIEQKVSHQEGNAFTVAGKIQAFGECLEIIDKYENEESK